MRHKHKQVTISESRETKGYEGKVNMSLLDMTEKSEQIIPNPYNKTRGPSDLKPTDTENHTIRNEFIMVNFRKLMNKYPHIREAYDAGDIKIKDYVKEAFNAHRNKFELSIRSSRIRKWHADGHLVKPKDQRGTATESKLSPKDSEYWVSQQFDKMLDKVVNSYVFSVSDHWIDIWITNGAHRIKLDVRFHNPDDTGGIHRIGFSYELVIIDKFTNDKKTVQLKGIKSYKELMQKIGSHNFTELDNGFHPVDLYSFEQPTEALARTDHAILFGHSNGNLTDFQRIHSYYTDINEKIRPFSSWYAVGDDTLHKSIKEIWGNGKQFVPQKDIKSGKVHKSNAGTPGVFRDARGTKKFYQTDVPYEFMLHSFMMFLNGLDDSTVIKLDKYCRVGKFTEDQWVKYDAHLKYSVKVFKMCRKLNATRWHPNKLVQLFTFLMILKDAGSSKIKQYGKIIVNDSELAIALDNAVAELYCESVEAGEGPWTWIGARKSFKNKSYLLPFLNMLLIKLKEAGAVVLLDTERNIQEKQKALSSNVSWLTGKVMTGKTEYHHAFVSYAKGGNSLPITEENGNVVPIEEEHNRQMNNLKMDTFRYAKYLLETDDTSFTDEKRKFLENGGMVELKDNVNNERFLYQNTTSFSQDEQRVRDDSVFPPKCWDKVIHYVNPKK